MISEGAPTRKLRIGVAGLGRAFSLMLPTFQADPRIELVAAFDTRPEARDRFAADFDAPVYERFEDFVADGPMEAVYVASPHQFHGEQTARLAARGLHVLVEKPMALTLADCDSMIAAADAGGVHLIVGHCHSFDTPYLRTRELIRDGHYGAVRMIQANNYTDFLYRPRRPEELNTEEGGGVVFSQAAHQVDIVRLLAGSRPTRVRALTGAWDRTRPTEGAYSALLSFESGAFASLNYSGYAHFDSDEWCGWTGELGGVKSADNHGSARRRLREYAAPDAEATLKNASTYGGPDYVPKPIGTDAGAYQHFGPIIVSCDRADIRPMSNELIVYTDGAREQIALGRPEVPRHEVIDELYAAIVEGVAPLHDGRWAKGTLQVCLGMLESARQQRDIELPVD